MRANKVIIILASLILVPLIGCQKSTTPVEVGNMNSTIKNDSALNNYLKDRFIIKPEVNYLDSNSTAKYVTSILPGKVLQLQKDTSNNINVWKVTLQTSDSAVVVFTISIDLGIIIEIKGDIGPFNYNIIPSSKFINLMQALDSALVSLPGQIIGWDVKYFKNKGWKFTVYIQTDSGIYYVRVEAWSGKVGKHHHDGDNDDEGDDD